MTSIESRITAHDFGRTWPSRDGVGFVAAPDESCPDCPSIGSTLCNFAGESLVFDTREDAVAALNRHAEHGCPDVSDADADEVERVVTVVVTIRTRAGDRRIAEAFRAAIDVPLEDAGTTIIPCDWCPDADTIADAIHGRPEVTVLDLNPGR